MRAHVLAAVCLAASVLSCACEHGDKSAVDVRCDSRASGACRPYKMSGMVEKELRRAIELVNESRFREAAVIVDGLSASYPDDQFISEYQETLHLVLETQDRTYRYRKELGVRRRRAVWESAYIEGD